MDDRRKEFTFQWSIRNYSHCWHKTGKYLFSPDFSFDGLEDTPWTLVLFPRGFKPNDGDNISLLLYRREYDVGPEVLTVNYELSIIAEDATVLQSREFERSYQRKGDKSTRKQLLNKAEINFKLMADNLPNDILIIRCRLWKGNGSIQNAGKISACTDIFPNHFSFIHTVEGFSKLQPNVKTTTRNWYNFNGLSVSCSLYYNVSSCGEENIIIEIDSSSSKQRLRKCKFSLMAIGRINKVCGKIEYADDTEGRITDYWDTFNYTYDAKKVNIYKIPLPVTREVFLEKNYEYLLNDELSLLCECKFFNGLKYHSYDRKGEEPLRITKLNNFVDNKYAEKISGYPSVSEEMKALYIGQRLTDVELKTKTKSFPAHKIILCARSPVFESMITSNIEDGKTVCIDVEELENDTVEQLLIFLYSDDFECLTWKTASQLYSAADKFQIGKLKAMCTSLLVKNLSIPTIGLLFGLCRTHNDSELMKVVRDYQEKWEDEIHRGSGEYWMETE